MGTPSFKRALLALAIVAGLAPHIASAHPLHQRYIEARLARGDAFVGQELLVQFKPGVSEAQKAAVLGNVRGNLTDTVVGADTSRGVQTATYKMRSSLTMLQATSALNNHSLVAYAEPNWRYKKQVSRTQTIADPYLQPYQLWGMHGNLSSVDYPYGTNAYTRWQTGPGCSSNVYVAVVDEGIMTTHADLKSNIWVNTQERRDGRDNDRNGYVDDINGFNFVANNGQVYTSPANDDHGTHVAGTIGAVRGNNIGVAGMCGNVKLISAKFMDANGGTLADAIRAIDYVTNLKVSKGLNIVAMNASWGGGGFSQSLADAITRAGQANILFITAAGNESANLDVTPSYPAAYSLPNMITVAALDKNGQLASFSNYGMQSVDIAAPGVSILSTVPNSYSGTYAFYTGTSMATPHVTGAAALYASSHPHASAAEIKQAILAHARPLNTLQGKVRTGATLDVSGL